MKEQLEKLVARLEFCLGPLGGWRADAVPEPSGRWAADPNSVSGRYVWAVRVYTTLYGPAWGREGKRVEVVCTVDQNHARYARGHDMWGYVFDELVRKALLGTARALDSATAPAPDPPDWRPIEYLPEDFYSM